MRTIAVSAVFIATMTLGGVTVASATFDSVWGEWVTWAEVPERTDSTAVSVDDGACVTVDLIYACEGEEGDYAAIRLVPPAYPYHVQQVGYVLRHGAVPLTTSLMCDAGLAHDVVFFVGDATSYPDASPVEIERLTVPADSGSQPARWVHVQPSNPIKLSAGEALFVSVEMVASVSGGSCADEGTALCLQGCPADNPGEETFWSYSTSAPYSWGSMADLSFATDGVAYMSGLTVTGP